MSESTSTNSGRRSLTGSITLLLVSLVFALVIGEIALRLLGYTPWYLWERAETDMPEGADNAPMLSQPHPVRGWSLKPGLYKYPGYSADVKEITVTILPDGNRATSAGRIFDPNRPTLVFVGCSMTMGFAISDSETFAWKVQEQFPEYNVVNLAVPGYGTYQSLLTLEEKIAAIPGRKIVFYGVMAHHLNRNVLDASWINVFSPPGKGQLPPYVSMNEQGEIVRHPESRRTPWYFKDKLAIVQLAEQNYVEWIARDRNTFAKPIFEKLTRQMEQLANSNNAKFVVVLLNMRGEPYQYFKQALKDDNFSYLDCVSSLGLDDYRENYTVKGEGHPNGKMNSIWAKCIADYLHQQSI